MAVVHAWEMDSRAFHGKFAVVEMGEVALPPFQKPSGMGKDTVAIGLAHLAREKRLGIPGYGMRWGRGMGIGDMGIVGILFREPGYGFGETGLEQGYGSGNSGVGVGMAGWGAMRGIWSLGTLGIHSIHSGGTQKIHVNT
jgi:hypothetical protein